MKRKDDIQQKRAIVQRGGGYGREKRRKRNESREIRNQEEITELRSIVMELTDKIEELHRNRSRTRIPSASPDTSASIKKARNNLEPMNKDYKKVFRDDVVNILKSLDASLQLDYKNRWTDIEIYVVQNVIPAIKKVLGERFHYTDTGLKKVLQNYHRHQRDTYILSLNPQKQKANRQRTGINSRRKDKKERRQRGLKRMIDTKDQMLTDLEFSNLIKDLREIINDSNYHSDEVSETDEEEAQEEKNMKIRPSRNENTNHVLHLRILLRRADEVGEATQNLKIVRKRWYDDQMYIDNSKPPRNAPEWAISSSYQSE
ncbi:15055_t:CDS:2 [Rhizophagus irregularis]|nr:15055_t:CDS:2 [Rhizophagus irregularis]